MWLQVKNWVKGAVILAVVGLCLYLVLPIQSKIKLGLDLQGGVRVLLQLHTSPEVPQINRQIQGQVMQVIDARINGLGVAEPQISSVGNDRILVELPNVKNPDEAVRSLKDVAKLDYKIMPEAVYERAQSDKKYAADPNGAYKDSGPIVYSGADIKSASSAPAAQGTGWRIVFETKDPAKFGAMTQANLHKLLALFLDKKYTSAANIEGV